MRGQLTLNDGQSRQVLAMLLSEGKAKGSDIRVALAGYRKRVEELRAELRRLEGGDGPFPMDRIVAADRGRSRQGFRRSARRRERFRPSAGVRCSSKAATSVPFASSGPPTGRR